MATMTKHEIWNLANNQWPTARPLSMLAELVRFGERWEEDCRGENTQPDSPMGCFVEVTYAPCISAINGERVFADLRFAGGPRWFTLGVVVRGVGMLAGDSMLWRRRGEDGHVICEGELEAAMGRLVARARRYQAAGAAAHSAISETSLAEISEGWSSLEAVDVGAPGHLATMIRNYLKRGEGELS